MAGVEWDPFSIVFTKADKLSGSRLNENIQAYKEKLNEQWEELPPVFITSSSTAKGKDEILDYIDNANSKPKESQSIG
jgi:Predicted GTPase